MQSEMSAPLKCLAVDYNRYQKTFQVFLDRSLEHQCMKDFIRGTLPDILKGIGEGKTAFSVIGVGSGSGEMDLEILTQLHQISPDMKLDYDVVEPSSLMLDKFKALVSRTQNLEKVNFMWNQMVASEFEKHWRDKQPAKKTDFIHMIQMLYYVPDPGATVSFFRTLLNKNGKLLIILVSGESGWGKLWKTFRKELCPSEITQCITTADIKRYLTAEGITFEAFLLPSTVDITECFVPGNEKGELLLDFLTEVMDFSNCAPPQLKTSLLDCLRHPDCSTEVDGKVVFNNNLEALLLGP